MNIGTETCEAPTKVAFLPTPQAHRHSRVCAGVTAETVYIRGRKAFESRYCGPLHLLIAHESLARRRGTTTVEGLPDSNLENLSQTFTFVPAGRQYREWHDPDFAASVIYIHIDPATVAVSGGEDVGDRTLLPRLHFYSAPLWEIVLRLKALVERGEAGGCAQYGEALGIVLAHELLHLHPSCDGGSSAVRGGLAVWQRRLLAKHLEEHLAEEIPVGRLAELVRLSRYHFCRAFRRSFGVSPHRYHSLRRLERAKALLESPALSVTEIALDVGFRESSSFSTAFRKLFGRTPSDYRRSLSRTAA